MASRPRHSTSALNVVTGSSASSSLRGSASVPNSPDVHQRPGPGLRTLSSTSSSLSPSVVSSRVPTPRHSPLIPSSSPNFEKWQGVDTSTQNFHPNYQPSQPSPLHTMPPQLPSSQPTICGLPLKYVSLLTLALQNAALSIVMHYSRVSIHPDLAYSPATAVLMNELLKGGISFVIAFLRSPLLTQPQHVYPLTRRRPLYSLPSIWFAALSELCGEVFSADAWKLSIPAILYVVQNSLQFVAISNLPVATFQVTYQMKILTTAAFSVAMLRKKVSGVKWLALFILAIGVGIVQLQTATTSHAPTPISSDVVGSAQEYHRRNMSPLKGFGAVTAACFTSGLAGVYFEMVLKGSKADLWVRNVQLSLFSLIPALLPILYSAPSSADSHGFIKDLFRHFGGWAWATVSIQVFGGLVTAIVIKYSDNILKGFATSLSIVLSFLASVVLFDFQITPGFLIGASTVLTATWMYNQPAPAPSVPASVIQEKPIMSSVDEKELYEWEFKRREKDLGFNLVLHNPSPVSSGSSSPRASYSNPGTPVLLHSSNANALNTDGASSGGVLMGLGVGSFMRRKPSQTGPGTLSRTSSTASLTGLLSTVSERISTSTASLPLVGSSTPNSPIKQQQQALQLAESGEVMHAPDDEVSLSGISSRMTSRVPSRAPSPSPTLGGKRQEGWLMVGPSSSTGSSNVNGGSGL